LPRCAAGALALSALASTAEVQGQVVDQELSAQRFYPAPGPDNFVTTRALRMPGKMQLSFGLMVDYAYRPFIKLSCATADDCGTANTYDPREIPVVENLVAADVMASLSPLEPLQIGLRVPVIWAKGQGLAENGAPTDTGINILGVGDPELEGKLRLVGGVDAPVALGAALYVTGPLGNLTAKNSYIGDPTPGVGLRAIADVNLGPVSLGANLGGILRGTSRVGTTNVGSELRYAVAAGYAVTPSLRVLLEGFGSTRLSLVRGENTLEALLGAQLSPEQSGYSFVLGGGTGVIEGIGVPTARAFLGFTYATGSVKDSDGDGIPDDRDQCPTDPEDFDGYEDDDGCPEPDNDLDGIPDAVDKCPLQAEDFDGFQDDDGCPDPDNDGDGIPDASDRCPDKPETVNGFQDEDGCPDEADRDGDGVPDERDQCPDEPEDTDGFKDEDGCPDPDNDGDGIPDTLDECIDEPETFNGYQDEDGCPDEAPKKPKR
jgi:hypothetical protein